MLYLNFLQLLNLVYEIGNKKSKSSYIFAYLKQLCVFKSLFKILEVRCPRNTKFKNLRIFVN